MRSELDVSRKPFVEKLEVETNNLCDERLEDDNLDDQISAYIVRERFYKNMLTLS